MKGKTLKGAVTENLAEVLRVLRQETRKWKRPIVGEFAVGPNAPYRVLISTVMSLRTKDTTTEPAANRLFAMADNPAAMLRLTPAQIEKAIYPVGFYRTKARNILEISRLLLERHGGRVPDELDELLALPGVGRKTANLTVTVGYEKPGICVDTHVHRISNRWDYVRTDTPEETEQALRRKLPPKYWLEYNELLVAYGQNLCVPISPFCSRCTIANYCPQRGVRSSR